MASLTKMIVHSLFTLIFSSTVNAAEIDAGYDPYAAAQEMINKGLHSWEWGTAAEALLELYNPELSVFSSDPFPEGKIPNADSGIFALRYAEQYINTNGQVFVDNSAVGDPASLGVSAILLGQSNSAYIDASNRQADYILNDAPRWTNGAISHRPDVAELWADNMAMSFPFLAYLAVQKGDTGLMATTVTQCGLQRDILQSGNKNWQHIIGPQAQDTGLWSTGNGWAGYGMVRVLHTLQKWSGSSSMTLQAGQLKGWIKEILDGAMQSATESGLLRNYLDDNSWFGEISGTGLLSAIAYRMAVNDPVMFPQPYISWADNNRKIMAQHQGTDGVFSPAVDPYGWQTRTQYTSGSPEGQAFAVYLYTAYRDCVNAGVCARPGASAQTISKPGIGPVDIVTYLHGPVTGGVGAAAPTGSACGPTTQSCDADGCAGAFAGLTKYPACIGGARKGCQCTATNTTCGPHQDCDLNGCAGQFDGFSKYAQCTGNFVGCQCTATNTTCGPHQDCDLNGCAGQFDGFSKYAKCTGNFIGCGCTASKQTCGPHQSCDLNGCAGAFTGSDPYASCTGNFIGCECTATNSTCGNHQSCDLNGCAGKFSGLEQYAQCSGNFLGCSCTATTTTCGSPQSCDLNGCAGEFNLNNGKPYCANNFIGCECLASGHTCGDRQSCDLNNCKGAFKGSAKYAQCTDFFKGCNCNATPVTCGVPQDCGLNDCAGEFNLADGKAYCTGNFAGCECKANSRTCGNRQSCDQNNCKGAFSGNSRYPQCTNFFKGCDCDATPNTCGAPQDCSLNGCEGSFDLSNGKAYCRNNFVGCECKSNPGTCGAPQSCDQDNCAGAFTSSTPLGTCTSFFKGCSCQPTSTTCGTKQSCDSNGCAGGYDSQGVARCQGNFHGCPCNPSSKTCGVAQNCDLNGCAGTFDSKSNTAVCRGKFAGCVCLPVVATCPKSQPCDFDGCNGAIDTEGNWHCLTNYFGCSCIANINWGNTFTGLPQTAQPTTTTVAPPSASFPPTTNPWYVVGLYETDDSNFAGTLRTYSLGAMNMNKGTVETSDDDSSPHADRDLCGATIGNWRVTCNGDITKTCQDPGVATWGERTCRTYCPDLGDNQIPYDIFDGDFAFSLTAVLTCDRTLA